MKKILMIFGILSIQVFSWDLDNIKDQIKDDISNTIEENFDAEDYKELSKEKLEKKIKRILKKELPFDDVDIDIDEDEVDIEIEPKSDNKFVNKEKIRNIERKLNRIIKGKEINIEIE